MGRRSFLLPTGKKMEYEVLSPTATDPRKPAPFLVSVSGRDQFHVNGFSQRLTSENWTLVMALRPPTAPLLFQGKGAQGDGPWHLHELCRHLLQEFSVCGGRFLMVGVSNGGNSVLRFATLWPELCCGVVVATGSLQGLVELPAACRKMRGVPVDMYVGTKDECGFYQPMVALEAHFREVGHQPPACLTVFRDAGHICSPLIDEFLIHGKIALMLLHAGLTGASLALAPPRKARRPSDRILAKLTGFSKDLGLQCNRAADGTLEVSVAGGPLLTMKLPALKRGAAAAPMLPVGRGFKAGDRVEVWSNSKQRWEPCTVVQTSEGEEGGVQVVFEDERGKLSKMVLWAYTQEYLRSAGGASAAVASAEGFSVGDHVAIWSASNRRWVEDGQVSSISTDQGITVNYFDGSLSKLVPLANVAQYLRQPGAREEEDSPQSLLPDGASKRLLLPGPPGGGGGDSGSRPSSSSRSPVSAGPSPLSRNVTTQRSPLSRDVTGQLPPSQAPAAQAGLPAQFPAGCRVAIWSESSHKWFEDGQVAEASDEGVVVVYAGATMQKLVLPPYCPQLLRRLLSSGG